MRGTRPGMTGRTQRPVKTCMPPRPAGHAGFSEIDIAPLSARSPIRREHMFDAGAYGPASFYLILCNGQSDSVVQQEGESIFYVTEGNASGQVEQGRVEREPR